MDYEQALNMATPDERTSQNNIDFLEKEVYPALSKELQLKMKAVLDGFKQQSLTQKKLQEVMKKQKEAAANAAKQSTAQVSQVTSQAQTQETGQTAQVGGSA